MFRRINLMKNISKCPDELESLIESINLLPDDIEKFENDFGELVRLYNAEIQKSAEFIESKLPIINSMYENKVRNLISQKLLEKLSFKFKGNMLLQLAFNIRRLINERSFLIDIIQAFSIWEEEKHNSVFKRTFTFSKAHLL